MAEVRFEHVYKAYGENTPVIRDLNLQIYDHEFLVLVGPSGCGKSTALRMIAGLEEITSGDLSIGERRVNDVAPKDRDIAMVFQNYALYPHMSVYDNMAFSLKLHHASKQEIDERVDRAARMLGITDYLKRKPRELSGGQRQRVALGRALVREPKVFLLDEPLSNLDAKLRVQTRAEIARLHQATQTTFVYVTHDQVEAMTMGDRIAVMNAGVIQQLGTPQELYDHPANLFVAGFIGSPSMDFFEARLVKQADGSAAAVIGPSTSTGTSTSPSTGMGMDMDMGTGTGMGAEQPQAVPLTGAAAEEAAGHALAGAGRPVIVGIRPEDFALDGAGTGAASASDPSTPTMSGVVDVAEHLGNEQLVYLRLPGAYVPEQAETKGTVARIGPDVRITPGDRITLRLDTSKLHVFDADTKQRIPSLSTPATATAATTATTA
jgi:multiple sugar transport system ATP-binding protein